MTAYRKTIVVPVKTGSRDHRHANQRVLASLDENTEGRLTYNSVPIVDANLLEQSLLNRDLLLLPYVVVSFSTYLSLAAGLPKLELLTFDEKDPIATELCKGCTISQYNTVLDTSAANAHLVTESIEVGSRYQPDNKPRQLWISTMPSYEDLSIEIRLDDDSEWYGIPSDQVVAVSKGFSAIQVRLSLPRVIDSAEAERTLYSLYILYK